MKRLGDVLGYQGRQLVILNADGSIRFSAPYGGAPVSIYDNNRDHDTPSA